MAAKEKEKGVSLVSLLVVVAFALFVIASGAGGVFCLVWGLKHHVFLLYGAALLGVSASVHMWFPKRWL